MPVVRKGEGMGLVLGPSWAVSFYRRATNGASRRLLESVPLVDNDEVMESMAAKPTKDQVQALRLAYPGAFAAPPDLYVAAPSLRFRCEGAASTVRSASFPRGSFGRLRDGSLCPVPAHAVVALSAKLPDHYLVELACELAGSYRKDSRDPRGMVGRDPVLTAEGLRLYVEDAEGMGGVRGARKICPYVIEQSGSPMETTLYALFCLGIRLGGAGLPKPEMNARIDLSDKQRAATGRSYLKADMLWRENRVVLEYDSDWAHGNARSLNRDAARRNALQELGYTVITVTKDQVFDRERFLSMESSLARTLGKPTRAKKDWEEKRFRVWRDLTNPARFGSLR